jgi:hypothetical protein
LLTSLRQIVLCFDEEISESDRMAIPDDDSAAHRQQTTARVSQPLGQCDEALAADNGMGILEADQTSW